MRIFLDTNVIVSAFATRGLCADVFRLALADHELVTAGIVLAEVRRALKSKIRLPVEDVDAVVQFLRSECEVGGSPAKGVAVGLRDRADRRILAAAIEARVDIFVTGDREMLELATPPVLIVNPRGLWERIRRRDSDKRD